MLHPSTKKLIDRLAVMTAQKKIDWIEKDNGDVLYATEGYVVRLTPEPPRVLLSTDGGKPLEDASSNVLAATAREDGGTYGDLVTTLARDACRDARGTEDAISTLLAGLSETPAEAEEPAEEAAAAEAEEPETADVYEEVTPDAVEETGDDLVEDPVDETTALSAAAPDPAEAEVTSSWSSGESDDADASPAVGVTDDEDLVDASVPEAAIVDEASSDDEATAFSSEADASEDNIDVDTADIDTETVATLAGEDDADSETEVSGAVARLADEVNATPVDPIAAGETEASEPVEAPEEPEAGLSADDAAAMEQADTVDETEEDLTAPQPVYEADDDTQEHEAEDDEPVSFSPTPSFSVQPDDAPDIGVEADETAPEAAAPVADEDETPVAEAEQEIEADDGTSDDVTPVAPVWDAAESETTSEEDEAVSVEAETETSLPAAASSNVHYVPFGAGGIEAEGADVSQAEAEEQPLADETESSIATAATMMSAPDEAADTREAETAPEPELAAETVEETLNSATAEPVSAPAEPADEPDTIPPGPISLSGMGAGLGFGRTATGFQPTAPRPSAPQQADERVTRGPVFIDATDDFTVETEAAAESANVPDVTELSDGEDYVEASVSEADLEAVAPQDPPSQATAQPADAETSLSLVDNDNSSEIAEQEEDAPRPARPKTRFNPWT